MKLSGMRGKAGGSIGPVGTGVICGIRGGGPSWTRCGCPRLETERISIAAFRFWTLGLERLKVDCGQCIGVARVWLAGGAELRLAVPAIDPGVLADRTIQIAVAIKATATIASATSRCRYAPSGLARR